MSSKTEKKLSRRGAFLSDLMTKMGMKKRAKKIKEEIRQDMKKISKRGSHGQKN